MTGYWWLCGICAAVGLVIRLTDTAKAKRLRERRRAYRRQEKAWKEGQRG